MQRFYPIGTPGEPWTARDRAQWAAQQTAQRSYADEVLAELEQITPAWARAKYGALSVDPDRYPLWCARPAQPDPSLPWALVTGGVHGYETSGVQGALRFLLTEGERYLEHVNLLVFPCVSPWGYERINRWNPHAIDPNRSFVAHSESEEAASLMAHLERGEPEFVLHIDLHETTDTDESEFRPALAARDGKPFEPGSIPDGFYTVGDSHNPQLRFQSAIITSVAKVTHIAPPDDNDQIIGSDVAAEGVILYPFSDLGLCAGVTAARFTTTTEVYPDSPRTDPEQCIAAQVEAVTGALDFALQAGI